MASVIQDPGTAEYLTSFGDSLIIPVMSKLSQWSFQQQLSYNAQLPYIANDFMGLQDVYDQFSIYSASNPILSSAWNTIKSTVKLNLNVNKEMYVDPSLGKVGDLFETIPSYGKVFAASSDDSVDDLTSGDD